MQNLETFGVTLDSIPVLFCFIQSTFMYWQEFREGTFHFDPFQGVLRFIFAAHQRFRIQR